MGTEDIQHPLKKNCSGTFLTISCLTVCASLLPPLLGLMAPGGQRPGMQQQEGWVSSASAPPLGSSGPGQQSNMQARMGPSSAPMRPNSQPGPRPMIQSPMMANGESTMCHRATIFTSQVNSSLTGLIRPAGLEFSSYVICKVDNRKFFDFRWTKLKDIKHIDVKTYNLSSV